MRRAPPARSFVLTTARPSVASASVRSDATRLTETVHVTAQRASVAAPLLRPLARVAADAIVPGAD